MCSLTEKYQPVKVKDFCGLAEVKAVIGEWLLDPYPAVFLFCGPAGCGKSTIAAAMAAEVNGEVHHVPSGKCDKETTQKLSEMCHYMPMFGGMHVVIVEEADQMTKPAQIDWLSALDTTAGLPNTLVIFTCNDTAKLEGRFLQRCREMDFGVPTDEELAEWLKRVWATETTLPLPALAPIIVKSKGSVRSCLMQLEMKLLVAKSAAREAEAVKAAEPEPVAQEVKRSWFETMRESQAAATPPPATPSVKVKYHQAQGPDGKWARFVAGEGCPCQQCRRAA